MKKIIFLFALSVVAVSNSAAQKSVALHRNGTTTIFYGDTPLTEAYEASESGDTLYVSGGNFAAPDTINKGLVIIGAGYNTDSTAATQKTYLMLSGNITIGDDAGNLYMEGMEFQGGLHKPNAIATDLTIIRCKINGDLDFKGSGSPTNSAILQCDLIQGIVLQGFTYSVISNCIIRGTITYSSNNIFKNNVILYGYYNNPPMVNCHYNTLYNNIFSTSQGPCYYNNTCRYNNFQRNIFILASPFLGDYATDTENYRNIDLSTVYVNAAGGDFHLLEDASNTYLGDDGTEAGIYGGMSPFKEGAVPVNPHISGKSIVISTDNNGFLKISFKVSAQQN